MLDKKLLQIKQWTPFTKFYSTGVARVLTVVSGAFYHRVDVCNTGARCVGKKKKKQLYNTTRGRTHLLPFF